jgi:hypothetical protein
MLKCVFMYIIHYIILYYIILYYIILYVLLSSLLLRSSHFFVDGIDPQRNVTFKPIKKNIQSSSQDRSPTRRKCVFCVSIN